jgi:hypothetical protein
MQYVSISVADLRAEPKFSSERVSQLVYGEEIRILRKGEEYTLVVGNDGLQGYMKTALIKEGPARTHKLTRRYRHGEIIIPFGGNVSGEEIKKLSIPAQFLAPLSRYDYKPTELSKRFLGVPYLWGGTSEFGFDCSGFTQRLYRFAGVELPRNADWQRDYLDEVTSFKEALPGDLIFFEGHVGLHLGKMRIIHANGRHASVTTTDLSDHSEYSKRLLDIFEQIGRVNMESVKLGEPIKKRYA